MLVAASQVFLQDMHYPIAFLYQQHLMIRTSLIKNFAPSASSLLPLSADFLDTGSA